MHTTHRTFILAGHTVHHVTFDPTTFTDADLLWLPHHAELANAGRKRKAEHLAGRIAAAHALPDHTVPGIGPRTAAQLAVSVDIGRFPDHDHLASYCGIAPRVRSSGTSVRSVRASRRGDARLKSLLIFSCNSLVRSSGRYGEYYRACRARGMGHGRALKAVARKRLRAIYAVMRDRVPYRE